MMDEQEIMPEVTEEDDVVIIGTGSLTLPKMGVTDVN